MPRLILTWVPLVIIGIFIYLTLVETDQKFPIGSTLSSKLIEENLQIIQEKDINKLPIIFDNSSKILKKIPIDDEVLVHIALAKYMRNPSNVDMKTIDLARKRNPRNKIAAKLVLWNALEQKDWVAIVRETNLLYRLNKSDRPEYRKILSSAFKTSEGRALLKRYISKKPVWGVPFLIEEIEKANLKEALLLEPYFDDFVGILSDGESKEMLITKFSDKMIKLEQNEIAVEFWEKHNKMTLDKTGLFNSNFKKLNVSPPFNWILYNNRFVVSEFDYFSGLFASFRGTATSVIIRQYFRWEQSQSIDLKLKYIQRHTKLEGEFYFEVRCAHNNELLAVTEGISQSKSEDIHNLNILTKNVECGLAFIDLKARPGKYARPISITLNYIDIDFRND